MVVLAAYQGWKARHISTEFQENRSISRGLYTILLVLSIGLPSYILSRKQANARIFIISSIIFVACISILLNLFVPKYRHQHQNSGKNSGVEVRSDDNVDKFLAKNEKHTNDSKQDNGTTNRHCGYNCDLNDSQALEVVQGSQISVFDESDSRSDRDDNDNDSDNGELILCRVSREILVAEIQSLRNRLIIQEVRFYF